ncbi:hypothetical protein [Streptomyces sp. NPDC001348]
MGVGVVAGVLAGVEWRRWTVGPVSGRWAVPVGLLSAAVAGELFVFLAAVGAGAALLPGVVRSRWTEGPVPAWWAVPAGLLSAAAAGDPLVFGAAPACVDVLGAVLASYVGIGAGVGVGAGSLAGVVSSRRTVGPVSARGVVRAGPLWLGVADDPLVLPVAAASWAEWRRWTVGPVSGRWAAPSGPLSAGAAGGPAVSSVLGLRDAVPPVGRGSRRVTGSVRR